MVTRRRFLGSLICAGSLAATNTRALAGNTDDDEPPLPDPERAQPGAIDRFALVSRHNPYLQKVDSFSPLTVGNGEFAFTADVTGLQTFPEEYDSGMPLCTLAQWGWHTSPKPPDLSHTELRLSNFNTHGRQVGYATSPTGQNELFNWLRENPHRLHLGRIGLRLLSPEKRSIRSSELSDVDQTLDMWTGVLKSRFVLAGKEVVVRTAVHPERDLLAVSVESALCTNGQLGIRIAFPYGSSSMQAADWSQSSRHRTSVTQGRNAPTRIHRTLDGDEYFISIDSKGATLRSVGSHDIELSRQDGSLSGPLEFVVEFSSHRIADALPTPEQTFADAANHWARFWQSGAAVEFTGSRDPRAHELERRVVLSQYLTAIQCSGSIPPQETGLTVNSWYGKFHLEMHWWHAAHFAVWNRLPLFERSLAWYTRILPSARARAQSQGYSGARWPKMVGPDGRDSPSPIGPLLIWQQPHPIFYAELCYRLRSDKSTLERYREIVHESATFLASFAYYEREKDRFVLGPPVIPAQENHPADETWNPTFELAYVRYALNVAQQWRVRLGQERHPEWDLILKKLSPLPELNGVFLAHENCPQTYTERNIDHPSMLYAYGMIPGDGVNVETMRKTLFKVMRDWQWDKTWGWDYPAVAMNAARLGEASTAVDALLMNTEKNRYLSNGHNWQRANLPCYLPGNGGLLYAVAMMAGGWPGARAGNAPGFPSDGSWSVKSEGFVSSRFA